MRTVLVAAISTINAQPAMREQFVARLKAVREADTAAALGSTMTDDMLQERADWILRLLPPELRSLVQ